MPPLVVRPVAALLALWWWIPFFGVIDLTVTWDPEWQVVLEAGWGLFFTFVVGLPFVLVAVRPRETPAAVVQLVVGTGVLAAAAVVSLEWQALVVASVLALATALVAALRGRPPLRPWTTGVDAPLLALAAISSVPWSVYAWQMAAANRQQLPDADITNSVDHYSVQAAFALAMVALTAAAALRSSGRRLHGTTVAVCAIYLGLVSYSWPGTTAGFGAWWSVLTMVWGGAVGVAAWWPRSAPTEEPQPSASVRGWRTSRA